MSERQVAFAVRLAVESPNSVRRPKMQVKRFLLAACAAVLPLAAAAQEAHATKWVNLRAGPARDYPLVATLGPGTLLAVQGCTQAYAWCDVIGPDSVRGWIYAGNIAYPYQGSEVPVISYGTSIGLPIIVFSIGSYWGQYYTNRPWYASQGRWAQHPPPRPPRPIVRPPDGPRPPGVHRPPPGATAPGVRPPGGGRPPGEGRSPGGRPGRATNEERTPQR